MANKSTQELTETAQKIGCSPLFVEFERLPLTFSQITLIAGLTITNENHQTGPHYASHSRNNYDMCVETGPEGTIISFNYPDGGSSGEVVFDAPIYRSKTRHIINAYITLSPGDFQNPQEGRYANLYIGDMGMLLSSTDDGEMTEKYGVHAMQRRRWSYNNRSGFNSLGYQISTTGGIEVRYTWSKDEHVYGFANGHNTSSVIPFFGSSHPIRIKPKFEAKIAYADFKRMLNQSGRKKNSGGALYWAYSVEKQRFYAVGAHSNGKISKEGRNYPAECWSDNSIVTELIAGTVPYRPFGEAVVNRYKDATHAGVGIDAIGRQYLVLYYPWGHLRFNHITFAHAIITDEETIPASGSKVTEGASPPYLANFDLTFEYSPYNEGEEKFLNKWYLQYKIENSIGLSRPILPTKGEILAWWICYCQHGEITDNDEILARKILS